MLLILNEQAISTATIPLAHKAFLQQRWDNLATLPNYDPVNDGYAVYLTEAEVAEPLTALNLNFRLDELSFEGGWLDKASGLYNLECIPGNSFGWEFVIPHSETFNPEQQPWLAKVLEEGVFTDEG